MMIPQMEPSLGIEERVAVYDYMCSGGWLTEYKLTRRLERMIADYVGSRHCIMMPNGTLALYAALRALRVGLDDEVLVPDFTMVATATSVGMAGAWPHFVDIDLDTLCLDLDWARLALSPRTKGMILVSLNGRSPDMWKVREFCRQHDLWLLEDACQALGSTWRGKHLGTFGEMGVFSFSSQKIITTGNGGCVVTDDDEFAHRLQLFKNFGREHGGNDDYGCFGINLKFTDLQAVVGIEQMKKLPDRAQRKKEIYTLYRGWLEDVPGIEFIPTNLEDTAPWFVDLLVEDRDALMAHLKEHDIETRPMYPALHTLPFYSGRGPNSKYVAERGLWLPSSLTLTNEDIEYVCQSIRDFLGW